MPDLFISYRGHDRPWAERLFHDLQFNFPTLEIFWDRDSKSLPPNVDWAKQLKANARATTHLIVLWSGKAKESNQVVGEIEAYLANVEANPKKNSATRTTFYIPLEGEYGPLEPQQGFAELRARKLYSADTEDRGTTKLEETLNLGEWNRIVRTIGDTALEAEGTTPIKLALLVMNQSIIDKKFVDAESLKTGPEPTLGEFLHAYGLDFDQVKSRYGRNAFEWKPFGTGRTVIELMEDLRVMVNRNLEADQYFHWVPFDLFEATRASANAAAFRDMLAKFHTGLSAVIVDPISLYHTAIGKVFTKLGEYAARDHSVIVSIAPRELPALDMLYESLRSNGAPVLDRYFLPQIPGNGTFARCCVNVEHMVDMERLVRGGLGIYRLLQKGSADDPLHKSGA